MPHSHLDLFPMVGMAPDYGKRTVNLLGNKRPRKKMRPRQPAKGQREIRTFSDGFVNTVGTADNTCQHSGSGVALIEDLLRQLRAGQRTSMLVQQHDPV